MKAYVEEELLAIARSLSEQTELELRPIHAEPTKPREGMIVFADGTDWDPGAGKGVYTRSGSSWVKL
jgi:hypothetical protein